MARRPQPPEPIEHAYSIPRLNRNFAIASLICVASLALTVLYDYRRDWKTYQKEFQGLERQKTDRALRDFREKLDKEQLRRLQSQRKAARALVRKHRAEIAKAEARLAVLVGDQYRADQSFRFTKATLDAARATFEVAFQNAKEANGGKEPKLAGSLKSQKAEYDRLAKQRETDKAALEKVEAEQARLGERVAKYRGAVDEAEKSIKKMNVDRDLLLAKRQTLEKSWFYWVRNTPLLDFVAPSLKVEQVLLDGHLNELNYMKVPKVDRCMTCHKGIDKKGYESFAELLRLRNALEAKKSANEMLTLSEEAELVRVSAALSPEIETALSKLPALDEKAEAAKGKKEGGLTDPEKKARREYRKALRDDVPTVFRTHPNLDTFVSDGSAHPLSTFGCTSCHGGRDRSVSFIYAGHTPENAEQQHEWEEKYGWFNDHFNETPMYPIQLVEAGCYRCHSSGADFRWRLSNVLAEDVRQQQRAEEKANGEKLKEIVAAALTPAPAGSAAVVPAVAPGAAVPAAVPAAFPSRMASSHAPPAYAVEKLEPYYEAKKLDRGVRLIENLGCFGCHKINGWENRPKTGPSLDRLAAKTTPEWTERWISDPFSFRKSSRMPKFFHLENFADARTTDAKVKPDPKWGPYNDVMVRALTAYLFEKSERPVLLPVPVPGDAARGKVLVETVGCYGCHMADENAPRQIAESRRQFGPNLAGIGSKSSREWIYTWVKDPKAWSPTTRMPDLRLSDQEAADIAEYLVTLKAPAAFESTPLANPDDKVRDQLVMEFLRQTKTAVAAKAEIGRMDGRSRDLFLGEKLVTHYGCYACHEISGFEKSMPIGTELTEWGNKTVHRLDFGFFETPRTSHGRVAGKLPPTRQDWVEQKLEAPRSFDRGKVKSFDEKLKMPWFALSQTEVDSIRTVVLGLQKDDMTPQFKANRAANAQMVEKGRRIVRDSNCQGCHVLDQDGGDLRELFQKAGRGTFAPPLLKGEGHKVQPDWLAGFLKAPKTGEIRPWLDVRMPTFEFDDEELNALTAYFAITDGASYPFDYTPVRTAPDPVRAEIGDQLFTKLQCQKCHPATAADFAKLAPEDVVNAAPILSMSSRRLRYDWIADWIKRPDVWMPGTKMPTFFPGDGKGGRMSPVAPDLLASHFPDPLDRELHRQDVDWIVRGLRDKVWALGGGAVAPSTPPAVAAPPGAARRAAKVPAPLAGSGGKATP